MKDKKIDFITAIENAQTQFNDEETRLKTLRNVGPEKRMFSIKGDNVNFVVELNDGDSINLEGFDKNGKIEINEIAP